MSIKKAMFVTHNHKQGAKAASTTRCGFFVAFSFSFDTRKSVIASVIRSQSDLPLFGIVRGMPMALFLFSAYHEGKYIHTRIKSTNKTMRPTQSTTLDFIKRSVKPNH